MLFAVASVPIAGEEPVLKFRATVVGAQTPLTIEVHRWSTDAERSPLMTALAPVPTPAAAAAPAAGRGARAGGRGGRGGAAPPASPIERLTTAIKVAPTVGFVWGDGPTGYSIKYAWRSALPDGRQRLVLVTDRRLGAHSTSWPASTSPVDASATVKAGDAEFTVLELRIDTKGLGEAKTSHASPVIVDAAANTLAIDKYDAAPVLLKVTR
ncbi:MAG TPA: hypothetical protein VM818_03435 [Vicinamibacterales bacterium]|nr:hypothetical protein [Vicinamibacterales bacterium]